MPIYTCELCQKEFKQKGDLTKHKAKKTPCITMEKIQILTKIKEDTNNIKDKMKGIFNKCLDILRSEGLTGDKALRNLSYILILKLIEPQFRDTIDIQNYPYEFSVEDEILEHHKSVLMKIVYFSELVKEEQDNLVGRLSALWTDVLSQHPSTKNIFLEKKTFDIKRGATFKRLIDAVNSIPDTTADVLGEAYEDVIKDLMTGKVLGQFFTEPRIKKIMIKLVNPQLHADGTIETCGDPTMGTGGFLITYIQEILAQSKKKNIVLNWDFIKNGLYGKELEPDTYQLAVSNMLISSGHLFEQLDQGDSLHEPIDRKFDIVLSNPPFGIKGIKYDDFKNSPLKDSYTPIKTDNAVSLFIQAIVCMLNVGGRCAVVLPDGQDLFSKDKTFSIIREYLMKTCDLKEILYLPSGIFANTPIKTCIFFFVKKCEGADALKVVTKTTASKKVSKDYTFEKKHHTKTVQFYDYNPYEEIKNLLVEVPIEKIVEHSYSLNYAEYLKDEVEEYEDGVVVKTLGELFYIEKGALQSSKNIEGNYSFITASETYKTHESFTHDCECVMLVGGAEGSLAKAQYFNGKFIASDLLYILIRKNDKEINYRYIWYYLNLNKEKHLLDNTICCGTPKKMISKDRCSNIKIPIPSLERQQDIVNYLDFIYEKSNKTSITKISELKQLNEFCLNNQKIFGENVVKELGEVFKEVKTGKDVVATDRKKGEYPFYGANGIIDYVDGYIFDGKYLLTARTGSLGSLHISNGKFWCSGDVHRMEFENDTLLSYTYYYLQTIDFQKFRTGSAHPKLSGSSLKSIKILIPSIERQKEIVEYCEYNDTLIKQLEKEIENNKRLAQQFMTGIVKLKTQTEEHDTSQVNIEPIDE